MKKYYLFVSKALIEAESEDEAIEEFADNSFDFASNAEVQEFENEDEAYKKEL